MSLSRTGGIAALAFTALTGQANQATEVFEVASIKPDLSGSPNTQINLPDGGRMLVTNATVKTLVRNAYGLLAFQMAGGPKWLDDDKFDINAKTSRADKISSERLKPLLQSLLAERFGLRVHWETRQEQAYILMVDKGGPRFQLHSDTPGRGMNTRKSPHQVLMRGTDVPMAELASNPGNQLGRFVTDQTGLGGQYDLVLEWDPDQMADTTGPSLFTALREQLGLRLEPGKALVQVLVIDSVTRPTEN